MTLTNSFVALFNSAGTIIGQSVDQSTAWETGGSTGVKTIAFAGGPFTVKPLSANDFVWVGIYCGTFSTAPAFVQAPSGGTLIYVGTTSRARKASIAQANTATLASITPGSLVLGGYGYWCGLS